MRNRVQQLTFALLLLLPSVASAEQITLQVYQVCDDGGLSCAPTGPVGDPYFAAATAKIWAQAGITVLFNFVGQINNSLWLDIDDDVVGKRFEDIAMSTGNFQSSSIVDMFLVNTVKDAYGEGWSGSGGLVMGMVDILGYAPGGRIDTMAHELGHNLGLVPETDPDWAGNDDPGHSNNPNHLMAPGALRNVPLMLGDINPDGLGYDQLTSSQIQTALQSTLLQPTAIPEPTSVALIGVSLTAFVFAKRRRRA